MAYPAHIYCATLLLGKNGNVVPHTKKLDIPDLSGLTFILTVLPFFAIRLLDFHLITI